MNEEGFNHSNTPEGAGEGASNKRLRGESVSSGGDLSIVNENINISAESMQSEISVLEAKKQKLGEEAGATLSPVQDLLVEGKICMDVEGEKPLKEPDSGNQDLPEED